MTSIWQHPIELADLAKRSEQTLAQTLSIEFIEVGDDFLKARMPVDARIKQPLGIMHGGASCALAETVGSTAANFCVDQTRFYCVGLDINTNHIRSVNSGFVYAIAKPYHLGKTTQVWSIEITNEAAKLVSINRLTMAVLSRSVT